MRKSKFLGLSELAQIDEIQIEPEKVNYNSDEEMSPTRKRLPDIKDEKRRWKRLKTMKLVVINNENDLTLGTTVSLAPCSHQEIFHSKGGNSIMSFMEYHTNDIADELILN